MGVKKLKISDDELADRIVHVIAKVPVGTTLGSLQVARGAGLPCALNARTATLAHLHRAMNLAVGRMPQLYPGRALSVDRSSTWATYRMIDDVDADTLAAEMARMRQVRTKVQRVQTVTSVAKDGAGLMLHNFTTGLQAMLGVVDQIGQIHEQEQSVKTAS